jgi:hypothetical protein
MFWRAFIILLLVAGIFGGSAYFINELYLKEKKLDVIEQTATPAPEPEPTPDPSIAAFEAIKGSIDNVSLAARDALVAFLAVHPDSPRASDVRKAVGRINLALLRNPETSPGTIAYTVKKGDSLVRIAAQNKSNAELIYWANELPNINLQIGQQLIVPSFDGSLVVDRAKNTVTLFNNGEFFREYPAVSMKLSGQAASGEVDAKVADRVARKGEARVAFGHKDYADAERFILLSPGAVTLRPPAPVAEDGTVPPAPAGIVLAPEDFIEIFVLVKTGIPVTIK